MSVDQYVVQRVQEDIGETSRDRVTAFVEGMFVSSYLSLAMDEDDRAEGYKAMARRVWETYQSKIYKERTEATTLRPLADIERDMLNRVLDPQEGLTEEARAVIRTKLGLPAETPVPAGQENPTNAVPTAVSNAVPVKVSSK